MRSTASSGRNLFFFHPDLWRPSATFKRSRQTYKHVNNDRSKSRLTSSGKYFVSLPPPPPHPPSSAIFLPHQTTSTKFQIRGTPTSQSFIWSKNFNVTRYSHESAHLNNFKRDVIRSSRNLLDVRRRPVLVFCFSPGPLQRHQNRGISSRIFMAATLQLLTSCPSSSDPHHQRAGTVLF